MANLLSRTWRKRSSRSNRTRRPEQRRPQLEALEDRTLMSVSVLNNGGNGYAALHFSQTQGYVPPDTNGAAGPDRYVETVNQTIAIYNPRDTGASSVTDTFSHFWFTVGGLPHADGGSGLSDPVVNYDDVIGRFVVADQDVNFSTHVSRFDVAVSKTSSPSTLTAADWNFYSIVTTESGRDADYPGNFGYNADAVVFTLNMFNGAAQTQVISISQADLAANSASPGIFKNFVNDFSLRPTAMHGTSAGGPMYLVTEHGDNSTIDVYTMTNVLTNSATFVAHNIDVANYINEVAPKNPNGTSVTTNIDARIQKASERNNILVAAHSVGVTTTEDDIQWYQIDVSNPSAPSLMQQGRVGYGTKTYLTYPAIEINAANQIGMTFMKQGNDTSTDFVSMYVTGRDSSDAAGTMQTAVIVNAGAGVANYHDFTSGGRSGDLGGINVDPVDNTTFWAANEFANNDATANWGTAVAQFQIGNPPPATDMAVVVTGPSSVTAGTNAVYTITLTNNGPNAALGVILSDLMPAGSSFVSISQTGGTDTFTQGGSGGTVTETATGSIASGSSDTFQLTVFAPNNLANGAAFNDTATVTASNPDPNNTNNSSTQNGTIVNNNPSSDLQITMTGAATGKEGGKPKYTITVKNNGPTNTTGVVVTDTLGSLFQFIAATTTQGTFSHVGNVVTYNIGSMAAGATVTLTVTGQALEDGSSSNSASVTGNDPDPNGANNSASKTTVFSEPAITVSAPKNTTATTLNNFLAGFFNHANGVEPVGDFIATINWGDSTTSQGNIVKSGAKYNVFGSHTYSTGGTHTISISVVETGQAVDKVGDDDPGEEFNHLPFPTPNGSAINHGGTSGATSLNQAYVAWLGQAGRDLVAGNAAAADHFFSQSDSHLSSRGDRADWFAGQWLNSIWS